MPTKKVSKEVSKEHVETPEIIPHEIDDTQYITVRNGFHGTLVYISRRTGEKIVWDEFGAEQDVELRELKYAKNSRKNFFTNNWFMFNEEDSWVLKYLGVDRFYKNAIGIDGFDNIFKMKPRELEKAIAALSAGQKKSVAYRAYELIAEKKIDSLSVIETLERALGIQLMEK